MDSGFTWSVVYDFLFWYCVEGSGGHHGVVDSCTKFAALNPDVTEEGIDGPSLDDHDFSGYTLARKSSMEKSDQSEWVTTSL